VKDIFLNSAIKFKWLLMPCFIALVLCKIGILPRVVMESTIQLISVIVIVMGLPLSAGLRIDQLSWNLGTEYSRETVLFISLIVTYINLTALLFIKRLIFPIEKNKNELAVKNQVKGREDRS
jgi:uncharacterized membrane protein